MAASSNEIRTAVALVRLATGERHTDWTSLAWRDVASLALRERCIALAWLRSSETIADHADAELVAWWRDLALRTLARGHAHLATLGTLADSMARAEVQCVILKGAPLSAMLHGEPGARSSADLDVWIPLGDRPRARAALLKDGWQYADGAAPDDEAFTRPGAHGEEYLEVHSNLLHGRLDYLPLPDPEYSEVSVAGSVLPVMTGSLLPAYLAVHIARHQIAPLVWLIDHRALWGRLDDDARSLARWTAQRCGVHRYLAWVLRRTALLDRVMDGDPTAVERLGLLHRRRNLHPMWREIQLAPASVDAVRAMWAWLMPPWARSGPVGPLGVMRRVRRYWRAAIATTTERARVAGTLGIAAREVTISGEHMLRVVREVSLVGGRVWISTTGTSMLPTLHETDEVLLEPAGRVAIGDVVLIDACGAPLLHRIVRVSGERITTRGDSRMTADATLRREDVIARAVSARRGDREWSLIPRAWLRLRLRARFRRGSGAPEGGLRVGA